MSLDELVGAWNLQSFEFTDAGGAVFHPLGKQVAGTLVVTPDGHAVFSFSSADRAPFANADIFQGTDAERAAAAAGYVSFGGPCTADSDTIFIEVEYSLFPNWVGTRQARRYALDGDTLTLATTGPRRFGGVERSAKAVLHRA